MPKRIHLSLLIIVALALSLGACSDTPQGDGGVNSGGGGTTEPCKGSFCLEEDRRIAATPDKLAFDDIEVGKTWEESLTLRHVGSSGLLRLTEVKFVDDPSGEFSVVDFAPVELASTKSVTWKIRYTPKKAGKKALELVITTNASKKDDRAFEVPIVVRPGVGSLKVSPDPIDFGPVASNETKLKGVKIFNNGNKEIKIASVSLSPSGSKDFKITQEPDYTKPIAPQQSADMELSFTPTPGDADFSELTVEDENHQMVVVAVSGAEITPRINLLPKKLQFGDVKLNQSVVRMFKVTNQGLADLEISKIEILNPAGKVKIELDKQAPIHLAPEGVEIIEATMTALASLPNDGSPVATIILHSNDHATPKASLPCFAKTLTASLKVTPGEIVDFAIVGEGLEVTRKVTVTNLGQAPLTIKSVEITKDPLNEFELDKAPSGGIEDFGAVETPPKPVVLKGGAYNYFKVRFTAKGPVNAFAAGQLKIISDDPDKPVWPLALSAKRAKGASCDVMLVPGSLNFGIVSYGKTKSLQLSMKNIGSGYCSLADKVRIIPCKDNGCSLVGNVVFTEFAISPQLNNLAPGETGSLQIQFTAPKDLSGPMGLPISIGDLSKPVWYHGFIGLKFKNTAKASDPGKWYPADPTNANVSKIKPNLKAGVGKSAVSVLPDQVDFGLVPVGCKSKIQTVRIYNNGTTPVFVTGASLVNCGIEVEKKGWPGIPKAGLEITTTTPVPFSLQYAPQNVGTDHCTLELTTGVNGTCLDKNGQQVGADCQKTADCNGVGLKCVGQTFSVPLTGEGTLDKERTDVFDQEIGNQVDVLFVIDSSGSMGDEQENLAKNFKNFISVATLFTNTAYHVGIVTTDMSGSNFKGKLREFAPGIRVISNKTTKDPTGTFASLAKVGTNGSATEMGLAAAEAALTLPLVYDTAKSCKTNADCPKDTECVTGGDGQKACGGHNRGFLRKNAGLEIVFVSDEEDSSTSPINYYANFFMAIKGAANKNKFHAHAIIGIPGDASCQAQAGKRYDAVVKQTGGKVASICSTSFAQNLKDIGTVAFGLSHQFFLKMVAEKATIKVALGTKACAGAKSSCGTVCPPGKDTWHYDEASNSIIFKSKDSGGKCMPVKGQKVSVYYKVLCFP